MIMPKYIEREVLERRLELSIKSWGRDSNSNAQAMVRAYQDVLSRVQSIPTADVVEVVRCKDCKCCDFFYPQKEKDKEAISTFYCNLFKRDTKATDYCSCGVRKDG